MAKSLFTALMLIALFFVPGLDAFWGAYVAAWLFAVFMVQAPLASVQPFLPAAVEAPRGRLSDLLRGSWLFGAGMAGVCVMMTFLECRQPMYFTQDDGHTFFLPVLAEAMRAMWHDGSFSTWTGLLGMGFPTVSAGAFTLTYPVTYIAYAISMAMGSAVYTLEIYAWLHFMAAYAVTYLLLRAVGCRPVLALSGSFCLVLSGFNLDVGRSWFVYIATMVYFPALLLSLVWLQRDRAGWRWVLLTGAVIGVAYHTGNAQFWLYACAFWALGAVWIAAWQFGAQWRQWLPIAAAGLVGVGLAMPLAYMQVQELGQMDRPMAGTEGIGVGLSNLLLPYPWVETGHPEGWGGAYKPMMGAMYFFGGVFFLFAMMAVFAYVAMAVRMPWAWLKGRRTEGVFTLLAVVAFWMALGRDGGLWSVVHTYLYPFNKMRNAWKFISLLSVLSVVAGAYYAEGLAQRLRRAGPVAVPLLAVVAMAMTVVNAYCAKRPWQFLVDVAYLPMPQALEPLRVPEGFSQHIPRVMPFSPFFAGIEGYSAVLGRNYPAWYHVVSTGYHVNSFENTPNMVFSKSVMEKSLQDYTRQYGVTHIIVSSFQWGVAPTDLQRLHDIELLAKNRMVREPKAFTLYDVTDKQTRPLAFEEGDFKKALGLQLRANGLDIRTRAESADAVIANFLYQHWFSAYDAKGRRLAMGEDAYKRMRIENSPDNTLIRVRYEPPLLMGVVCGILFLAMAWGCMRVRRAK